MNYYALLDAHSLLMHYRTDEASGDLVDSGPNSYPDLTPTGSPAYAVTNAMSWPGALEFTSAGGNDYFTYSSTDFFAWPSACTVIFTLDDAADGNVWHLGIYSAGSGAQGVRLKRTASSGDIQVGWFNGAWKSVTFTSYGTLSGDSVISLVVDGADFHLYVNGALGQSITASIGFSGTAVDAMTLGGNSGTGPAEEFTGRTGQFAVLGEALSAADVLDMYTAATTTETPLIYDPVDTSVVQYALATFTVAAIGAGALTYQWYGVVEGALTGETSDTLTFPAPLESDGYGYYCTVTDNAAPVTSGTATLSVSELPIPEAVESSFSGDIFARMQLIKNPDRKEITVIYGGEDPLPKYACATLEEYIVGLDNVWSYGIFSSNKDDGQAATYDYTGQGHSYQFNTDITTSTQTRNDPYAPAQCQADMDYTYIADGSASPIVAIPGFDVNWTGTYLSGGGVMRREEALEAVHNDPPLIMIGQHRSSPFFAIRQGDNGRVYVDLNSSPTRENEFDFPSSVEVVLDEWFFISLTVNTLTGFFVARFNDVAISGTFGGVVADSDQSPYSTGAVVSLTNYVDSGYGRGMSNRVGWAIDGYDSGTQAYEAYKQSSIGYVPDVAEEPRRALVYNFEDDNYTWMDASEPVARGLVPVVSMQYGFNPGWVIRWTDLQGTGETWADLLAEDPLRAWVDFYSHGLEENMYWMTASDLLRSDQQIQITDNTKNYFVEKTGIDLDDMVPEWTTNKWKHVKQFYFHLETPGDIGADANTFDITMGWSKNLMDSPDWLTSSTVNLQSTVHGGAYKYDLRTTGRYLAMRMDFDNTQEIKMTGGDLDASESHGR